MARHPLTFRTPVRRGNGFMLLSILIVLGLVLYLMFGNMGGTSYMGQVKKARDNGRETAREISTQQMTLLITMYRQNNNNKLPKTPADLESPNAFNDPWGKEMTFSFQEKNGTTEVTYHSAGPDGQMQTADDVEYKDKLQF